MHTRYFSVCHTEANTTKHQHSCVLNAFSRNNQDTRGRHRLRICRLNQTRVCHVCSNHRSKEEKISTTCKSTLLATITIVVLSWSLLCCNQCAIDKSLADSMNSSCSCIKCVRYLFYQSELILQVFLLTLQHHFCQSSMSFLFILIKRDTDWPLHSRVHLCNSSALR